MIYIFDNITDKIDFATIIIYALESPKGHKFIFTGKEKSFYDHLMLQSKVRSNLKTYYPNIDEKYKELISKNLFFVTDFNSCIENLKKDKYYLYGTTSHCDKSNNIFDIKLKKKSAFVFGSENGLSKSKLELLHELVHYPLKNTSFLKLRHIFPVVYGVNLNKQVKKKTILI